MLRIATFVGRVNETATIWEPLASEETDGARDEADAFCAAMALFEASRPWGDDATGVLSIETTWAIRSAA